MPTTNRPSTQCDLVKPVDLPAVLDAIGTDHLSFENSRAYVIYGRAILKLIVTDGQPSEARAFTIECWDAPADGPEAVLAAFRDEMQTVTENDHSVP